MTPTERDADLSRLSAAWAEAVYLAGTARPGTPEWRVTRLDERHAAAAYLSVLADPYQPASSIGAPAALIRVPHGPIDRRRSAPDGRHRQA